MKQRIKKQPIDHKCHQGTNHNQNGHQQDDEAGFTLVEMALVVIIIGLVASGLFAALKVQQLRQLEEKQLENFRTIRVALRDFITDPQFGYYGGAAFNNVGNGGLNIATPPTANETSNVTAQRFPCPADPNLGSGVAGFGIEQIVPNVSIDGGDGDQNPLTGANNMVLGGGTPAICNVTGGIQRVDVNPAGIGPEDIYIGALPFVTLGLGIEEGTDAYRSQYTYAITSGATFFAQAAQYPGSVDPVLPNGTNPPNDAKQFVVISHGRDANGARSIYGSPKRPCGNGVDSENCDGDVNFVLGTAELRATAAGPGNAGYYDDLSSASLNGLSRNQNFWTLNANNHIFNNNNSSQGNIGVGTGSGGVTLNNLSDAKVNIQTQNNENTRHILMDVRGNGSNNGTAPPLPANDSFAIYLHDFTAVPGTDPAQLALPHDQAIIFENLDSNSADPDDGFYFLNTGNDGIQELAMYISPQNWVRIGQVATTALVGTESTAQTLSTEAGNGFLETPWVYTSSIEATLERGGLGTGIALGQSAGPTGVTESGDFGIYTNGIWNFFVDGGTALNPPSAANMNGIYIDTLSSGVSSLPRIGIGTNAPQDVLHVNRGGLRVDIPGSLTTTGGDVLYRLDTGSPSIFLHDSVQCGLAADCATTGLAFQHLALDRLGINVNKTFEGGTNIQRGAVFIDRDDNVGVNTFTPLGRLDVFNTDPIPHINLTGEGSDNGYIVIDNPTASGRELGIYMNLDNDGDASNSGVWTGGTPNSDAFLAFRANGSSRHTFWTSGETYMEGPVRIGPYAGSSNPAATVDVGGSVRADGFTQYSDRRLKTDIVDLADQGDDLMAKILRLQPVTYRLKQGHDDVANDNDVQLGFIAQDMREIFPELVAGTEAEDQYLSLDYSRLSVPLTVAVQKLYAQNQDLDDLVSAQDNDIALISADMGRLDGDIAQLRHDVDVIKASLGLSPFHQGRMDWMMMAFMSALALIATVFGFMMARRKAAH